MKRLGWMALALLLGLSLFDEGGRGAHSLVAVQTLILAWGVVWWASWAWRPNDAEVQAEGRLARIVVPGLLAAALLAGLLSALLSAGAAYPSFLVLIDRGSYLVGLWCLLQLPWDAARSRRWAFLFPLPAAVLAVGAVVRGAAGGRRAAWPFLTPNQLAAYLAFAAVLAMAAADMPRDRRLRWGLRSLAVLGGVGVVATASRGGVLALLVGGIVWLGASRRPRLRVLLPSLAIAAGVVAGVLMLRGLEGEDPYRYDRPRIWSAALEAWAAQPWTGLGPGQLPYLSARWQFPRPRPDSPARWTRRWTSAHSLYLEVLAEEGVLGGALFAALAVAFLLALARPGPRGSPLPPGVRLAPVVALLAQGLVEDLAQAPALVWPVLVHFAACTALAGRAAAGGRRPGRTTTWTGIAAAGYAFWLCVAAPYLADRIAVGGDDSIDPMTRSRLASEIEPLHPAYPLELGRRLRDLDGRFGPAEYSRALQSLLRARRLAPSDPEVHQALARLHMRGHLRVFADGGTAARAVAAYQRALGLAPYDPFLRVEAARAYSVLDRGSEALDLVDEALRLEPWYLQARLERVRLLGSAGRLEEARRAWDEFRRARSRTESMQAPDPYERILLQVDEEEVRQLRSLLESRP